MKRFIMILLFYLFMISQINSEIIVLKKGDVINGMITEKENDQLLIETEYGTISLNEDQISAIYYDENEFKKSQNTITFSSSKERKKAFKQFKKENLVYQQYKLHFGVGLGFTIAGGTGTLLSLTLFTPLLFSTAYNPVMTGYTATIASLSIICDVVGIIQFAISRKYYKKWQQYYKASPFFGYQNGPVIGISIHI